MRLRAWAAASAAVILCSGVAVAALPDAPTAREGDDTQWDALAIKPLSRGASTGLRLTATQAAEPIATAPERQQLDFQLTFSGAEPFGAMLMRAGAVYADAAKAHAMVGKIAPGTAVHLVLGPRQGNARSIVAVELVAGLDRKLRLHRGSDGALGMTVEQLKVDSTPLRIRGRAVGGLYWALRSAGASPQTAAEYLKAISDDVDLGSGVGPNDIFDLVVTHRKSATGETREGPLLYAGISRQGMRPIQLVRWRLGKRLDWIDANALDRPAKPAPMAWPVAGRITSTFGTRVHPILRFRRFHRGIDFGASSGTPIHASAAGQVTAAGWAGGYGRQVRISHGGGIATTYSHMSAIEAEPGSFVRQGQVIGYVGTSGMSTGAHLHYEVYVSGQAVDPLSVRLSGPAPVDEGQAQAVRARLRALLGVGAKRA